MAGKKKKIPAFLKIALIVIIVVFAVSQKDTIAIPFQNGFNSELTGDSDTIKAGAFNIQVFGTTKAGKDDVMDILSKIIREYDIVAIEEIRDSSQTALLELMELVNSDGSEYSYFVSERLGRTSSKEQYAYIYNTKTIEPIGTPFVYPEPQDVDMFHREPYIGSFKSTEGLFNATFVTIHTDPDEAEEEIYFLYEASEYAKTVLPYDETVVIMGDFNADGTYFDEDSYTPMKTGGYNWVIGNDIDTTTGATDCTYDRIVLTENCDFFTGDAGVDRFDTKYSLTPEFTSMVSDHYPIYAVFSKGEIQDETDFLTTATQTPNLVEESQKTDGTQEENITITGLNVYDEWITIANSGPEIADISGFRLSNSDESHSYIFPTGSGIPAGSMITLYSCQGNNSESELYWGVTKDVWNNTGDVARLYDMSGSLIETKVS